MSRASQAGLALTYQHVTQIIDHTRSEQPNEACGILGGREDRVEQVYPLPNIERSPVRYLAEPQAQVDAMLEIEDRGWEVVGIYHSHLGGAAYPSSTDLALAAYPDAIHLIVSLTQGNPAVLGAFRIQDGDIEEVDVVIESPERIAG